MHAAKQLLTLYAFKVQIGTTLLFVSLLRSDVKQKCTHINCLVPKVKYSCHTMWCSKCRKSG